jgi:hypothetical protein
MPDWSYRTVFRPLLFCLPAPLARRLALGAMATLARIPGGTLVIDFLGHMRPDRRLEQNLLGLRCPGPAGLSCEVDPNGTALTALSRFGFGFVEIGPITSNPCPGQVERLAARQAISYPDPPPNAGEEQMSLRLRRLPRLRVPLLIRVGDALATSRLAPHADALVLSPSCLDDIDAVAAASAGKPLLLAIGADNDPHQIDATMAMAVSHGAGGVIVDAVLRAEGRWLAGLPALDAVVRTVSHLRQRWGDRLTIIAGGVHEPEHALTLRQAGADLVQISTGLVFGGPGLPKRVNDAWLYATHGQDPAPPSTRAVEMTWFWTLLMGLGMLVGSLMALAIAATRVVLHYDEVFSGMSRAQLDHINPRLLAFMTHDRVTLAGTMVTIGVLYPLLSWFGIRRGLSWARTTVFASATAGFASFFLFLGFGYFDPFHAFVTLILLQFLLFGIHGRIVDPQPGPASLREDWRWRSCLWAQLLFIIHHCALIAAGCMIAFIGSTHVFVHEDLEFMHTTADVLQTANPRLVPLVAHDRASFGGMMVASGIGLLLPTLWGFRQGERWLWWTFLLAAAPAYAAAIGVHYAVGYTDPWHLAPAFAGAGLFAIGLGLSYPYLASSVRLPDGPAFHHKSP